VIWTSERATELQSLRDQTNRLTEDLRALIGVVGLQILDEQGPPGLHSLIEANEELAQAGRALTEVLETVETQRRLVEALAEFAEA
jgi:hypothetical protein